MTLSGDTLYGSALFGGNFGNGTVFALKTNGTGFMILYTFTLGNCPDNFSCLGPPFPNSDGAGPTGGLVLSGNTLYGTTARGGLGYFGFGGTEFTGFGTVFSLSFSPELSVIRSGGNMVLSWPANYAGFDYSGFTLQCTTNLLSPIWAANLSPPDLINGQYTVTNAVTSAQQFFRLIR